MILYRWRQSYTKLKGTTTGEGAGGYEESITKASGKQVCFNILMA